MMHVAFVLSVRGIPQLYAGEEIAMQGREDPDNRRDFPSEAFNSEGRTTEEQKRMFAWTREWIRLRREHAAFRTGRLIDLYADDETYVFARQLPTDTVIVAFNRAAKEKRIEIPASSLGLANNVMFRSGSLHALVTHGELSLTLPAQSAVALE